jgi:pimeloyl-ACP methyl ester carboxylesterase
MTIFLTHNRVKLALHHLRPGSGRPLLHLHALGEHSPDHVPLDLDAWPGPVFALDFTGHGASTVPGGGGYTSEVLMGDADAALQMIGNATVVGRGLGAYIALLIAGGRPQQVRGAILCDGAGLVGGGDEPGPLVVRGVPGANTAPDPFALVELASDLRPPDYVVRFAELAAQHSGLTQPIAVAAKARPDWLKAVAGHSSVAVESLEDALRRFASL